MLAMAACFFPAWTGFGALWVLGPEGAGAWSEYRVRVGMALCDFLAKHAWGLLAWHLRWRVIKPARDEAARARRWLRAPARLGLYAARRDGRPDARRRGSGDDYERHAVKSVRFSLA